MRIPFIAVIFTFFTLTSYAQKSDYSILTIADSLKENANAVVRLDQIDITIVSQRNMNVKTKRVVTVLNSNGNNVVNAYEVYGKNSTIKSIDAIILDSFGNEIKKIKRKDFKDQSAVSDGTLISDNRFLYLDYNPISYPYTVVFNCETETSTTAFIPSWMPITEYYSSVESTVLNISCLPSLGLRKKESQFGNFNIKKTEDSDKRLSYVATNLRALKPVNLSPA